MNTFSFVGAQMMSDLPLSLASVTDGAAPFLALVRNGRALALSHADSRFRETWTMRDVLEKWEVLAPALQHVFDNGKDILARHAKAVPLGSLTVLAPLEPRQVFCTIGNYASQIIESARDAQVGPDGPDAEQRALAAVIALEQRRRTGQPYICLKPLGSVRGPYGSFVIPESVVSLDWEVELGVIIGREARAVSIDNALEYVAGYCVVNDLTERQRIFRNDVPLLGTDWIQSKGGDGWLPLGPVFVPAHQIVDPERLRLELRLNGVTMQCGDTSDMVFGIAAQIAYLSHQTLLRPGDLICTGSPAGFGSHYGRYLRRGDVIEAWVERLGTQRISCA